jgi:hypothetical protein
MPLTPDEAEKSLRDIQTAGQRSRSAYGHSRAAPHLIVWGVVWVIGYGACFLRPNLAVWWPLLAAAGTVASFVIGYRLRPAGAPFDWRMLVSLFAVGLFATGVFVVFEPRSEAAAGAFVPLLAALYYVLTGLWARAPRIAVLGVALAALTLGGFLWAPDYFNLLLAVGGGGALILGGLWMRTV